jgi:biopolymer transport protein ExbD
MAIQSGSQAQINVTPLIDVLPVLLIIFMAIAPGRSTGFDGKIPQAPESETSPELESLVIAISPDRSLELNSRAVSHEELQRVLRQALAFQPSRAVLLKGAKELEYRDVAGILDDAREAARRSLNGTRVERAGGELRSVSALCNLINNRPAG